MHSVPLLTWNQLGVHIHEVHEPPVEADPCILRGGTGSEHHVILALDDIGTTTDGTISVHFSPPENRNGWDCGEVAPFVLRRTQRRIRGALVTIFEAGRTTPEKADLTLLRGHCVHRRNGGTTVRALPRDGIVVNVVEFPSEHGPSI